MADKKLEDMNQKEIENFLTKAWKKVDMTSFFSQVNWALSEPRCLCDSCDQIYQSWLEAGKEIYKEDIRGYERVAKEANILREEGKLSRGLSNEKYTRSGLQRALVFN